jgi:iron transport multicopper oxidase
MPIYLVPKIRAQPTLAGTNQGFVNATNSAILRYVGAPARDPTTISSIRQPLVETALHPLVSTPVPGLHVPGGADKNIRLEIGIDFTTFTWQLNGSVRRFISSTGRCLEKKLVDLHVSKRASPSSDPIRRAHRTGTPADRKCDPSSVEQGH